MPKALFHFSYFWERVSYFYPGLSLWSSYLHLLCNWDYRCIPPRPACLLRQGLTDFFCLDWPWTTIFLISAYQLPGITGMSHCAWLFKTIFKKLIVQIDTKTCMYLWKASSIYTLCNVQAKQIHLPKHYPFVCSESIQTSIFLKCLVHLEMSSHSVAQ
jgi:hypothetical protein